MIRLNTKNKTLFISFILSLVGWLMITLFSLQLVTISLPVTIVNSNTKSKINNIVNKLEFKVRGRGFDILYFFFSNRAVILSAEELDDILKNQITSPKLNIHGSLQIISISSNINDNNQSKANEVAVDLPVKLVFSSLKAKLKYNKGSFYITKNHVPVLVSRDITPRLTNIKTKPIGFNDLDKINFYVHLVTPPNASLPQTDSIEIIRKSYVKLSKTISNIPIITDGDIQIFPPTVTIKIIGDDEKISTLTKLDIIAKVSQNPVEGDKTQIIVELPVGIELIDLSPSYVKVKKGK